MANASITIVLILTILGFSLWGFNNPDRIERYGMSPFHFFKHKQWDRLIIHAFLHGDMNHLLFNLLALFFFGIELEVTFTSLFGFAGKIFYIFLFFSGVIISSIPDLIYHRQNPNFLSIGASGGIATLVFGVIAIDASLPICMYGVLCLPGGIWGIGYLLYSLYKENQPDNTDRINFKAHIAGAVWGFILIFILKTLLF